MNRDRRYFRESFAVVAALLALPVAVHAAEDFGDISVEPGAIYTGNTFHGYAEMRVVVENHSHTKTHFVTLVYPNRAWNNGNSISRLSRTAKLEPEAQVIVTLLQPPLPVQGDGSISVKVDNRHEGEVHAPNANKHCTYNLRNGQVATVFISRSLDYDGVEKLFHANSGAFTAEMAVGVPDSKGYGMQPTSWMPDLRGYGRTNWLELDYAPALVANNVVIYNTQSPTTAGAMELVGTSGAILQRIPLTSGGRVSTGTGWTSQYSFAATSEPVKTVRLEFGKIAPGSIAIDAVQLSGPSGSQWASAARASSDNSASASVYAPGRVNTEAIESLRAESPVSEWSGNWLAYSPFDAIVLNATDLNSMSPAVLGAIRDYLAAGGDVVVAGKTELPPAWHPWQTQNLHQGVAYEIGFGRCFIFDLENLTSLDSQSIQTLRDTARNTARYWQMLPADSGTANAVMPVVENLKIPTRGIVIIMLAFIIIIGPVNIFYLNRRKRRTWLLWTIPVISLATTLLVFAYSLMREGITPDTRIAGLTVLDQVSHQAATIGGTAFYCPLTPSGGLNFDFGTEATPLIQIGYGSGTSREVDWTQSQHFLRGWASARVPAHFHLRKSEPRRERIQVVNENGKFQVINGLGAEIKSLWVADAYMNFYGANNVAAGQKAGLILLVQSEPKEKSGASGLLRDISFAAHTDTLHDGAGKYLLPNTYIAVLDGNPFIENALGSASSPKRTKSSAVIFGILGEPEIK